MKWFKRRQPKAGLLDEPQSATSVSLREFAYLDEVSVYSLTSSPDRPPPVSMSQSSGSSLARTATAEGEGSAPLVASIKVGGELTSERSSEVSVERNFNIQSQFAALHRSYGTIFLLKANPAAGYAETGDSSGVDLTSLLRSLEENKLAVREEDLARGALIESRLELRAHFVFDATSFMQMMTTLAEKYPDLLQIADLESMKSSMEAGRFLAELLENLIPIEGTSVSHQVLTDLVGGRWIVDRGAFTEHIANYPHLEPLRVAGVAEALSFWKDTRRVLHSDAEFDVLGRISRTGLQAGWTPVKAIDTFRRVVPEAANQLLGAVDSLRLASGDSNPSGATTAGHLTLRAGLLLNQRLATTHGVTDEGLSPEAIIALVSQTQTLATSLAALNGVTDEFYSQHPALTRNEDAIGALRASAWNEASSMTAPQPTPQPSPTANAAGPILEVEFIAMYW